MEIFLKTQRGAVYSIEVNSSDTVLEMKQKIEMSLGVPVSKQTIFFKGKILLKDDTTLQELKIVDQSRLEFSFHSLYKPNPNISQVRRRTEQSSVPSSSTTEMVNIQDSPDKTITNQDPTLMVSSNEDKGFLKIGQSSSVTLATEDMSNENQMFQTERYLPSNSAEQRMDDQDLPGRAGSSNQVVQSPASDSVNEVIDIPGSPVRCSKKPPEMLRVTVVLPFSRGSDAERMFTVDVNANDNVEELRKELETIQQLNLPKEGYFLTHKQRALNEDQSFRLNGVAHGDTVEIVPVYFL